MDIYYEEANKITWISTYTVYIFFILI